MTTFQRECLDKYAMKKPQIPMDNSYDMSRVGTIILGGGQGTRLYPLTRANCKPAITFGGKYRLIDVPMSNAIHSGCHKIFIVTQFLSKFLHDHIFKTYRPGLFSSGFVEVLTVEEKPHGKAWFQGTADAIRQNLEYLSEIPIDYFLILAGDHLYQMNYQRMMHVALQTNADVVIGALPVEENQTSRFGILKVNQDRRITDFIEKPTSKDCLEKYKITKDISEKFQLRKDAGNYLGSMGIYLFKRKTLLQLLLTDMREDFGKHLIPTIIEKGTAAAYLHDGYWEDIGTIESYYHANMALLKNNPEFNWYDERYPLLVNHQNQNLPAPKVFDTKIQNSIICEGAIIEAEEISHSIIGPRIRIKKGTVIKDSYLIGNDFYYPQSPESNLPPNLQIGENCRIERTIIDKHVCIGNNVQLINKNKLDQHSSDEIFIRDGIIIVPRGAHIPDNFVL